MLQSREEKERRQHTSGECGYEHTEKVPLAHLPPHVPVEIDVLMDEEHNPHNNERDEVEAGRCPSARIENF